MSDVQPSATQEATLEAVASDAAAWDALQEEFGEWQRAGRVCRLWWRDDDLSVDSPALHTLADTAERLNVPVLVAVIPGRAAETLASDTAGMALLSFCQHGLHHRNHEPEGAPPSEFGTARPLEAVAADLQAGHDRMSALFGERFVPVFVPPWNQLRPDAMPALRAAGLRGASLYHGQPRDPGSVLPIVDADVDILKWSPSPVACQPAAVLLDRLVTRLRDVRALAESQATPLGILTHHIPMRDDSWQFMQRLIETSRSHACVRWMSAAELFPA